MKKKIVSIILALLCLLAWQIPCMAAEPTLKPGDTFNYTVSLTSGAVIAGFKIYVDFDTTAFSMLQEDGDYLVEQGSFSTKGSILANQTQTGSAVLWYYTSNVTASGDLFSLPLKVSESASGTYSFTVRYEASDTVDVSGTPVAITPTGAASVTVSGAPAERVQIRVSDAAAMTGEKVSLPVTISGNTGFAGFTFAISVPDGITLTDIRRGSLLQTQEFGKFTPNPQKESVNWTSSETISADGELLILELAISDTCKEKTHEIGIALENGDARNFVDYDYKPIPVEFAAGSLTVQNYLLGDADQDGEVLVSDLVLMAQHIVHIVKLEGKAFAAADVVKDNAINAADCVKLARYLVGSVTTLR